MSKIWLTIGAAAALTAAAAGWMTTRRRAALPDAPLAAAAGANVVFITVDTVRADHLPPYGYSAVETPTISQLAADGIRFSEAFTPVPMTLPAHASIFTGLLPRHHGVRDNGGFRLDPSHTTLADALRRAGYRTAAFVSAFVLDSRWGLAPGFDEYVDRFTVSREDLSAMARVQRRAGDTWAQATTWLEEHSSERFFLWMHFYDPHAPYTPPEPFRSTYSARPYDGEIAYVDSVLADVMRQLIAKGVLDRTLVLLLSDHGEGLGDHDEDEHGLLTYDSTLHVPWLVRLPHRQFAGRIVPQPVSLVDVYPTVLELLGLPAVSGIDGVSRAPMIVRSSADTDAIYAESEYPRLRFNWSPLTSVRVGGLKYIRAPEPELYDYRQDHAETTNLAAARPDAVRRLDQILTRILTTGDQTVRAPSTDPQTARELQSLGYVSGSPSPPATAMAALPNPMRRTAVYRRLVRAQQELERGDDAAGLASLDAVLVEDPELSPAHRALRDYWISRRRFDAAVPWMRQRLARRPESTALRLDLAAIEQAAGRPDRALETLRPVLERQPANVEALTISGQILRATGRMPEALDAFSRAIAASPDTASLRIEAAQTLFAIGRIADADTAVRGVLQTDQATSGVHYLLAQIAEARRDPASAEREYTAEIAVSPWDYRARFNLAVLLGSQGRRSEQIIQLEAIPAIAPNFGETYFYLAKALFDTADPARFAEAVVAARRGLALAPRAASAPLGHYVLADVYRAQGRVRESNEQMAAGRALEQRLDAVPGTATTPR